MQFTPKELAFLEKFGAKIALLREDQRQTQPQLAELADIDIATLIQIEQGSIDIPLYDTHRLHKALNIEPSVFFKTLS